LEQRAPFREDRAQAEELAREAVPVVDALVVGLRAAGGCGPESVALREALAMVGLLGRRAGELGLTPTAVLALPAALGAGVAAARATALDAKGGVASQAVKRDMPDEDGLVEGALADAVRAVALEGYVAAREERLLEERAARAASAVDLLWIAPGCALLALCGHHSAEHLHGIVERAARALLVGGGRSLVVSLRGLGEASPTAAAEVFAIADLAAMLGVTTVFCDVDRSWLEAAAPHVDVAMLRLAKDTAEAVAIALDAAGVRLRAKGLRGLLARRLRAVTRETSVRRGVQRDRPGRALGAAVVPVSACSGSPPRA
jgi:hypothetical protein